jgi:excisionase family DNA binding protein
MSAVAKTAPGPRYGSVAELAAYTSLSPKTIRRLIESGALRALRVGRRVLVPFEDIDQHFERMKDRRSRTREVPTIAITPTPARPSSVDPQTGRLLPLTDEERRERSEALGRALDHVDQITDSTDTDERWAEVQRNIDEGRPDRPLFGGLADL